MFFSLCQAAIQSENNALDFINQCIDLKPITFDNIVISGVSDSISALDQTDNKECNGLEMFNLFKEWNIIREAAKKAKSTLNKILGDWCSKELAADHPYVTIQSMLSHG